MPVVRLFLEGARRSVIIDVVVFSGERNEYVSVCVLLAENKRQDEDEQRRAQQQLSCHTLLPLAPSPCATDAVAKVRD